MLFESKVVESVCNYLEEQGYAILQKAEIKQHGYDIVAKKDKIQLYIEAKGETSSDNSSKRYGKVFNVGQVRTHVAMALYKSVEALSINIYGYKIRAGMALPDNEDHHAFINKIKPSLEKLELIVFWVDSEGNVEIESALKL